MKYSIIMPYYTRAWQLNNTITGFNKYYHNRDDWEMVIIEDYKNIINKTEHKMLTEIIDEYKHYFNTRIVKLERPEEYIFNPAPHYNQGAITARGKFLIITNPECRHTMDILSTFDDIFQENNDAYIVCACYNDNPFRWWQHTQLNTMNEGEYHWCTAINKNNYFTIGGFDEIYKDGIAFEDRDFKYKIQQSKLKMIVRDDLVVCHQSHPLINQDVLYNYEELWEKNRKIFSHKHK